MIFIIGNPRSGTSMLRLMLTMHPRLHLPPECGFMLWWYDTYADWCAEDTKTRLESFLDDLLRSQKIEFWNIDRNALASYVKERSPSDYAELCKLVYRFHAKMAGKEEAAIGDKNNFHLEHLETLRLLFPEAKFIHIIRDGRDVAVSYRKLHRKKSASPYRPDLPIDIDRIAYEWCRNIQTIEAGLKHVDSMTVRYEDLVRQPKYELECICEHLNVSYNVDMLLFHQQNRLKKLEPEEFSDWKHKTFLPIDDSAIGQYQQLSHEDIERFEQQAEEILRRYGYIT